MRTETDADLYHRLLKAQFVDNRRYADERSVVRLPPKYSIPVILGNADTSLGLPESNNEAHNSEAEDAAAVDDE